MIIKNLALHYLEKELYPALIAGFNYQIKLSNENLVLILDGLNDKFINFISLSLDVFFNFKKEENQFNIIKNELIKNYENFNLSQPLSQANNYLNKNTYDIYYSQDELLKVLKKLSFNKENLNLKNIIKKSSIKFLVQGNIGINESKKIYDLVSSKINLDNINNHKIVDLEKYKKIKQIDNGDFKSYLKKNLNKNDDNSAIILNYKIGYIKPLRTVDWDKKICLIKIIDMLLSESFFDILRSKEQLGYIVRSSTKVIGSSKYEYYNYIFMIQSPKKKSNYLKDRILLFIKNKLKDILELKQDQLLNIKETIKNNFLRKDENMDDNFLFNLNEIIKSDYLFNIKKILSKTIVNIKKEDIIKFYYKYFINNKKFKIISVGVDTIKN